MGLKRWKHELLWDMQLRTSPYLVLLFTTLSVHLFKVFLDVREQTNIWPNLHLSRSSSFLVSTIPSESPDKQMLGTPAVREELCHIWLDQKPARVSERHTA